MDIDKIKHALYEKCMSKIDKQLAALEKQMASIIESRDGETKSSVGDKYETGRAMMQLELQKAQGQNNLANNTKNELKQIDIKLKPKKISKGSLVITDKGIYFIAIGMGKVKVDEQVYFCVSSASPIGAQLLKKQVGDSVVFNGNKINILEIA